MIVQITHHDVLDGMLDAALARIGAFSASMSQQGGFIFRHVGRDAERPLRITTITAWRDGDSFRAWERASSATRLPAGVATEIYSNVDTSRIETFSE